jgi:hypothetical protein
MLAGQPLATRYAFPGGAASICPVAMPLVVPPGNAAAAQAAVALPIRGAVAAYRAWIAAALPRTGATVTAAWPAAIIPLPLAIAPAVLAGQATAQLGAQTAASQVGASIPIAIAAAAAVNTYTAGGVPAASDVQAVVAGYFGGPQLPAPLGPTVNVQRNPVGGPPTTLTHVLPAAGLVNLEQVFIRFVLQHLVGGPGPAFVTNGALIGPHAWPGGAEPICVTWHSCAGGGFAPFDRSVMWWPGTPL